MLDMFKQSTVYAKADLSKLLPYQCEGVNYALSKTSCIIADEMGLGKTIQAIAVLSILAVERANFYAIIICPLSLKINWMRELDAWLGNTWPSYISIVAYSELSKHVPSGRVQLLIVDEGHLIKNEKAQRSQLARRYASFAERLIVLTGTPFENRVQELWGLLTLVAPDYWCKPVRPVVLKQLPISVTITSSAKPREKKQRNEMQWRFMKRYCGPVKKETYIKGKKGKQVVYEFTGGSNLEELNRRLRESCMIRRLKKDVLPQLPPKRREIVSFPTAHLETSEELLFAQIKMSELTIDNYDDVVHKLTTTKVAFAAWSRYRHEQGLEKIDMLVDHINNCLEKVEKILIFAHHHDVIMRLVEAFVFTGCVHLTGDMSINDRDLAVQMFQNDPRIRIFIGSIRAAGVGLTLTAADMVLFAEIDPNPGIMNQAEDRAHRIGFMKDMLLIQYAVSDGSIDARLCKILVHKQDIASKALGVSNYG